MRVLSPGRALPANARILILKTHAIGDLLMTTPAIRDLRAAYPAAHVTLMTGSWSAPAVRANPHLDEILEFDDRVLLDRRLAGMLRLLWRVRRGKFDAAVIFHPSPLLHLFALLAGIPRRYGLLRGAGNRFLTAGAVEDLGPGTYYPVNFQRVAALTGASIGEPQLEARTLPEEEASAAALLSGAGVDPEEAFVLVAPGGGRNSKDDVAAKRWPSGHFAALLQTLRSRMPQTRIVLTGSAADAAETGAVLSAVPGAVDLTGRTTLAELFCLAGRARAVVCNDSALLHIAVARGTPVVAPFGPTSLERFVPPSARGLCAKSALACSPCYVGGDFPGCPIAFQCMRDLTPEALWTGLARALAGTLPAA
ncbi:MAG: lipopolysaccharide heptosyltransferase [Fibrobacteria bacterium]|jgi:lipopolysaccharide heptosyltransferase II|nr:lipopolysaccharide heptosyltransferase [Fibrobacteria bacterium]